MLPFLKFCYFLNHVWASCTWEISRQVIIQPVSPLGILLDCSLCWQVQGGVAVNKTAKGKDRQARGAGNFSLQF